jgi:hypothetical protein
MHGAVGRHQQDQQGGKCLQPVCCAILLGRAEVMTRYLRQNAMVRKLNVFLELDWLRARTRAAGDTFLSALTARHGDVIHWQPSASLLHQVRMQMASTPGTTVVPLLAAESRAITLTAALLEELLAQPVLQRGESTELRDPAQPRVRPRRTAGGKAQHW